MTYQRILVGIDGSDNSTRAYDTGVALTKALNATLYLTRVVNCDRGMDVTFNVNDDFYQDLYIKAVQELDPLIEQAHDQGVQDVQAVPRLGDIRTLLASELPNEFNIDLIILGNTGINRVKAMLIGSHTGYVVRHSKCDVLIVK